MGRLLRTLFFYFVSFWVCIICFIPIFFVSLLPAKWRYDNRVYFFFSNLFYRGILFATMLPVRVIGKDNIPKGPAIYAANHQSALDIPLLGSLVDGKPHIWLLKKEIISYPFLGFVAGRMGVSVDRSSPRRALKSITDGLRLIKNKNRDLMIFPEGGRYLDGKPREFLWGFAIIARKTKRPVVPVYISNVNKAYPPASFFVNYYPLKLIVGKPFEVHEGESDEEFVKRVYTWFEQQSTAE